MKYAIAFSLMWICASVWGQTGTFLSVEQFRERNFSDPAPAWQTLWITQSLREQAEAILGHSFQGLRVRYWGRGERTAWIFDEIGKEQPITIGVAVEQGRIAGVDILEYRESRGGEVRHPFFTRQFSQLGLRQNENGYALDGSVDGITGATLSVRAVKKVATLALLFHRQTPFAKGGAEEIATSE